MNRQKLDSEASPNERLRGSDVWTVHSKRSLYRSRGSLEPARFLQRFRCPVLIISTSLAGTYQQAEAQVLLDTLPTAWKESLQGDMLVDHAPTLILEFQTVAVKSPQRVRTEDSSANVLSQPQNTVL